MAVPSSVIHVLKSFMFIERFQQFSYSVSFSSLLYHIEGNALFSSIPGEFVWARKKESEKDRVRER